MSKPPIEIIPAADARARLATAHDYLTDAVRAYRLRLIFGTGTSIKLDRLEKMRDAASAACLILAEIVTELEAINEPDAEAPAGYYPREGSGA